MNTNQKVSEKEKSSEKSKTEEKKISNENLRLRVIYGLSGAVILVSSVCINEWLYFGVFGLICLFANLEFYGLLKEDKKKPNDVFGTVIGLIVYTLVFVIEKKILSENFYLILFPLCSFVFIYELYNNKKKPFNNVAFTLLGILYVSIPFSVMHLSALSGGIYRYQIVLGSLFLLWASDTGAYFVGKAMGRHKLFERVSPKKTWEGSVGGGILSLATAYAFFLIFGTLPLWQWMVLSLIIVVIGNYGDLVESSFKRSLEIKDSGSAIPGHGGFLDRFDGLLLAAPFVAVFLEIFGNY
jgi:phosphatidate cytidylyltransferase